MPPITISIKTKLETNDKFLRSLLSGLSEIINDQVTDFIEVESKEMANGAEIYNVPESSNQKNKIENPTSLSSSITSTKISSTKYRAESKVVSAAEHSSWVEWGTGLHGELKPPHYIYPKNGKYMTWIGESGERIFASRTQGQYPKPFMRGAIFKLKAKFFKVINKEPIEIPSTQSQMSSLSGLGKLSMGLHSQVDAKPESSTKMWDQSLRSQIKRK